MNTPDLNLIPTVQLWKMADSNPTNSTLQGAVKERRDFMVWLWNQNGRDSRLRVFNDGPTLFDDPFPSPTSY